MFLTSLLVIFWGDMSPWAREPKKHNKTKHKKPQIGLYQTKKILHSKENQQQNEKTSYRMEGHIHQ